MSSRPDDRLSFESAAAALKADLTSGAGMAAWDAQVREQYQRQIAAFVEDLRARAQTGKISWAQAAAEAQETRNAAMELLRGKSSPVGRALAEALKREGKTMNELVGRYTAKLFGEHARFDALSAAQKNSVYAEIIGAAGRSNPKVNLWMSRASRCGRGLLVLSIGISIYTISTSSNPAETAKREVAVTGAGIAGGVAGGALAGLACGPGAPVCVTVGAFVGGALAAFGVDFFWK